MIENLNNISNTIVDDYPHLKNFPWLPLRRRYTLKISDNQFNETSTKIINILVTTENVPDGTTLYLNIDSSSTATADDFETKPESVTINDNSGSVSWTLKADYSTEGNETLKINLLIGSTNDTVVATSDVITINDTSTEILGIPFNVKPIRLLSKVIYDISDTQSRGKYRNTTIPLLAEADDEGAVALASSYYSTHSINTYTSIDFEEFTEHAEFFTCLLKGSGAGRFVNTNSYSLVNEAFCGRQRPGIESANHYSVVYNKTLRATATSPATIESIYKDIEGREWVANTVIRPNPTFPDYYTDWSLYYVDGVNSSMDSPPHEVCFAEVKDGKTVIYNMYEFDNEKISILIRIDLPESFVKDGVSVGFQQVGGSADMLKITEVRNGGKVTFTQNQKTFIINEDSIDVREKFGSREFPV